MEITKEQTARIQQMEQHLDRASAAVMGVLVALATYLPDYNLYFFPNNHF